MVDAVRRVSAGGMLLPALGLGGWHLGDDPRRAADEMAALRRGVSLGVNLIDTAEMYGEGASETLVGRALADVPRDEYVLVSKVYPHNAGRPAIFRSCEASLKRLKTDHLDVYLLHWRGGVPLEETVACMEEMVAAGKIKRWGVSNFDTGDMEELFSVPGGNRCAVNQVLYNVTSRGIEYDLIPWLTEHNVAAMAYCPLAQAGRLRRMSADVRTDRTLRTIADARGVSVMQLMLAFVLRCSGVIAIPKSGNPTHVEENAAALKIVLTRDELERVDAVFLPPTCKMHLDIE